MAISLDSLQFKESSGSGADMPVTDALTHNCATGATLLLVWVGTRSGVGASSVTYNSVALTKRIGISRGTNCTSELWYMVNPPSGNHVVTVVCAAPVPALAFVSESWFGVDPLHPFRHVATSTGNSHALSATVSSAVNDLVVCFETQVQSSGQTANAGQTDLYSRSIGTPNLSWSSNKKAGATNVTMGYTTLNGLAYPWAMVSASLVPAILPTRLDVTLAFTGIPSIPQLPSGAYVAPSILSVTLSFTTLPSISKVLEARATITDFSQMGRWIQLELSRTGDGPDFEVNLVDVDIRFRGRRVWRDIN